jgi:hypothetical protein
MDITSFAVRFTTQGNRRPMSQTFTQNATVTFPAGVTSVDMTGYGARGQAGSTGRVRQYKRDITYYGIRKSDGAAVVDYQQFGVETYGVSPGNGNAYCDPPVATGPGSPYSSTQACYSNFVDTSYDFTNPPTTGASATGIGRTFPGSTGNVAQTTTGFSGVAVTAGTSYNLVIPAGGLITINYYA